MKVRLIIAAFFWSSLLSASSIDIPGMYNWKSPVDTAALLPMLDNDVGDTRAATLTSQIYMWDGASWVLVTGGGGGPGISTLNGLTASSQNFSVGIAGSDFNISSATSTHTFNLPTASATTRGALSSADWIAFNTAATSLGDYVLKAGDTMTGQLNLPSIGDPASTIAIDLNNPNRTTLNGTDRPFVIEGLNTRSYGPSLIMRENSDNVGVNNSSLALIFGSTTGSGQVDHTSSGIKDPAFVMGKVDGGTILTEGASSFAYGVSIGSSGGIFTTALDSSYAAAFAGGFVEDSARLTSSGRASMVHGYSIGTTSFIESTGYGSRAFGSAIAGDISADGNGSLCNGSVQNGGSIACDGAGSFSSVSADTAAGSTSNATASGSTVLGYMTGTTSLMNATGIGSLVQGFANDGSLEASEQGSRVFGKAQTGGEINADGISSTSMGFSADLSTIEATGVSSFASGYAADSSNMTAAGTGSYARGMVLNSGSQLLAAAEASIATGYLEGASSTIISASQASQAHGRAVDGGDIYAGANASFINANVEGDGTLVASGGNTSFISAVANGASTIGINGSGSSAFGVAQNGSTVTGSQNSSAHFFSLNTGSSLLTGGEASISAVTASNGSIVTNNGQASAIIGGLNSGSTMSTDVNAIGAFVSGYAEGSNSAINATANGATASGATLSGGVIESLSSGAEARGFATTASSLIRATSSGSTAMGAATNGNSIVAGGAGSVASGTDETGDIFANGNGSHLFGTDLNDAGFNYTMMTGVGMTATVQGIYMGYFTPQLVITAAGAIEARDDFKIKKHEIVTGVIPTIAAGGGMGTGPSVSFTAGSTDTAGEVSITTGTGGGITGAMLTVTFASFFSSAPFVVISPANANAEGKGYVTSGSSTFTISTGATLAASTTYTFTYRVIGK